MEREKESGSCFSDEQCHRGDRESEDDDISVSASSEDSAGTDGYRWPTPTALGITLGEKQHSL